MPFTNWPFDGGTRKEAKASGMPHKTNAWRQTHKYFLMRTMNPVRSCSLMALIVP